MRIDVPCDLAEMSGARAQVVASASSWGFPLVAELEIVLSELLTNAIAHAGSSAVVTCAMDAAGAIDLTVADHDAALPVPRALGDQATHGRGLAIVGMLSSRWGATPVEGDGKLVWAHLDP